MQKTTKPVLILQDSQKGAIAEDLQYVNLIKLR